MAMPTTPTTRDVRACNLVMGDLFAWAGRWREVDTLDVQLKTEAMKAGAKAKHGPSDRAWAKAMAPMREGYGRSQHAIVVGIRAEQDAESVSLVMEVDAWLRVVEVM